MKGFVILPMIPTNTVFWKCKTAFLVKNHWQDTLYVVRNRRHSLSYKSEAQKQNIAQNRAIGLPYRVLPNPHTFQSMPL